MFWGPGERLFLTRLDCNTYSLSTHWERKGGFRFGPRASDLGAGALLQRLDSGQRNPKSSCCLQCIPAALGFRSLLSCLSSTLTQMRWSLNSETLLGHSDLHLSGAPSGSWWQAEMTRRAQADGPLWNPWRTLTREVLGPLCRAAMAVSPSGPPSPQLAKDSSSLPGEKPPQPSSWRESS